MKYLKKETVVDAFKLGEDYVPDFIGKLLDNEYVESISIGITEKPYLSYVYIGRDECRYIETQYFQKPLYIVFEKHEPPKIMNCTDFYHQYEEINEQGAVLI